MNKKKILSKIIGVLAKLTLKRFQPKIIGITGSAGKTSTKEAIYTVLRNNWKVRSNYGNFNTEIGLPLTILGSWKKTGGAGFWLRVIFSSTLRLILPRSLARYPKVLVLEYAADRPRDIKQLLKIAKPSVSIITAIGDIPSHIEFYEDVVAVVREKARLVEHLLVSNHAILNADDPRILRMSEKTRAKVLTFGFTEKADVRITGYEVRTEKVPGLAIPLPIGIAFKLEYQGNLIPVRINGALGKPQAYAAAAATCVGIAYNLNLVTIAEALSYLKPVGRRMCLISGIRNSLIVDDSYNASPLSMLSAVDTLKAFSAKRKVAILGDMRELGRFTNETHRKLGKEVAKVFDKLIAIGPASRKTAEVARENKLKDVKWFEKVEDSLDYIKKDIKKGDLVLVKASLTIGLDKVVKEIRS